MEREGMLSNSFYKVSIRSWWCVSRSTVHSLQTQSPEFKPQAIKHLPPKKKNKNTTKKRKKTINQYP
jgi:hypothetical protein